MLFPFSFCIQVVSVMVQHKVFATSYAFDHNRNSYISNTVLVLGKVVQTSFLEGRMNVFHQPGWASSKIAEMREVDCYSICCFLCYCTYDSSVCIKLNLVLNYLKKVVFPGSCNELKQ